MEIITFDFEEHGDERGILISLEENRNIPFEIRRCYFMYNTLPGVRRGFHAHKTLRQVLVCVRGRCSILLDDGTEKRVVELDRPNKGLYITANTWREMFDFSDDAVLMVLADQLYDEGDYIRNYGAFLSYLESLRGKEEAGGGTGGETGKPAAGDGKSIRSAIPDRITGKPASADGREERHS